MLRPNLLRALCASLFAELAMAMAASPALAQVNVETFRSNLRAQPYFISLDGSLTGRLGNTQGMVIGGSVFAGFKSGDHLVFAKAEGDYAAFDGKTSVADSFMHARYNYQLRSWLYGEAFSQIQQNKFQRLAFRNIEGLGPRFAIVERPTLDLYYGTAYMFEYEELSADPGGPGPSSTVAHRWSNYFSFVLNLDQRTRFTSVLYVQPRFDDFADIRVLSDSTINVQIKKPLSLKLSVVIRYDNQPPADVKPTDLESRNSFSVAF